MGNGPEKEDRRQGYSKETTAERWGEQIVLGGDKYASQRDLEGTGAQTG